MDEKVAKEHFFIFTNEPQIKKTIFLLARSKPWLLTV